MLFFSATEELHLCFPIWLEVSHLPEEVNGFCGFYFCLLNHYISIFTTTDILKKSDFSGCVTKRGLPLQLSFNTQILSQSCQILLLCKVIETSLIILLSDKSVTNHPSCFSSKLPDTFRSEICKFRGHSLHLFQISFLEQLNWLFQAT